MRPAELTEHWASEYPEVDTASGKMAVLEKAGFTPLGYFALSKESWLNTYYRPLQSRYDQFLARHDHSAAARALIASDKKEIELYERYSEFVSYGYYIAGKIGD